MLTPDEISLMRNTIKRTFTTECIKLIKTITSDGAGGRSVVWTESVSFNARISTNPPSNTQQEALGSVVSDPEYGLIYGYDIDLDATCRIRIDGVDYEVLSVFQNSTWDLHGRANLRRLV